MTFVSENGTEIFGSLGQRERRDCLLRGTSRNNEKVALNFCGGIVSIRGEAGWIIVIITTREG